MNDSFCTPNINMLEMNWVGDWIGRRTSISPDTIAIYEADTGRSFTYSELNQRANRLSNALTSLHQVCKGEHVCVISRNRIEMVDLFFSAGKTGYCLAPISFRLKAPEIQDLINRLAPVLILYEEAFTGLFEQLTIPDSVRAVYEINDDRASALNEILDKGDTTESNLPLQLTDTFLLIHTGGTTSLPKICKVSHQQAVWNSIEIITSSSGTIGMNKELVTLPFYHIGGWNIFVPYIHFGGFAVLIRQFDPGQVLDLIEKFEIDTFPAVENMLIQLKQHPDFDKKFSSVKIVYTGGAACSPESMDPYWDRNIPAVQSYGLTEAGPSNFLFYPFFRDLDLIRTNNHGVGWPMFHCDFKLIDQNDGTEIPAASHQPGIICLRSLANFSGYLDDDEKSKAIYTPDGWIISGDIGYINEDGVMVILGRADNMFISGGENIQPEEIESILEEHPSVVKAVCVPVSDSEWGQVPVAEVIISKNTEISDAELIEYCKARIANYKVPKRIYFVDEVLLTGMGKPDRKATLKKYS